MKLAHVELWNWRNFAHVEFDLSTRLFVVGPNASGKSNLLDALRFVSDVARTGLRGAAERRGGMQALSNGANGTGPARLAFSFEAGPERRTYELDLSTDLAADAGSQDIRDYFTGIHSIHPNPVRMLEHGPYDECGTGFTRHAASLPNTVLERAIARIRPVLAAIVPEVPCLSHVRIGANDDIVFYNDDPGARGAFTHMRFSEGTLRLLGILFELATLPKNASLVLIETPELHMQASVVRSMPDFFAAVAADSGVQMVFTTHSPELLVNELIRPDQVLLLEPGASGSTGTPLSESTDPRIRASIEGGFPMSEVFQSMNQRRMPWGDQDRW